MRFIKNVSLGKKFLFVLLITTIPTIVLTSTFVRMEYKAIVDTRTQLASIQHVIHLRDLLQHLAEHRGLSNAVLNGADNLRTRVAEKKAAVEADIAALESLDYEGWAPFDYKEKWGNTKSEWRTLQRENFQLQPDESFKRHSNLIAQAKAYLDLVIAGSGLSLTSQLEVSGLVNILGNSLPLLAETIGQARGVSAGIAARAKITDSERVSVIAKLTNLADLYRSLDGYLELVFKAKPELVATLSERVEQLEKVTKQYLVKLENEIVGADEIFADPKSIFDSGTVVIKVSVGLWRDTLPELEKLLESHISGIWRELTVVLLSTMLTVLAAFLFAFWILRNVIQRVALSVQHLSEIEKGNLNNKIVPQGSDEIDKLLDALATMQSQLSSRIEKDASVAAETMRIKLALENCATAKMMVLDSSQKIVYVNPALSKLFDRHGNELTSVLSNFSVDSIVDRSISIFNVPGSNDQLISERLATLKHTQSWEIVVGDLTFAVTAAPVINDSGEHSSTVIEWRERTMEIVTENEVQSVVDAAKDGDMTQRIALEGKNEFLAHLGTGFNQLMEVSERVVNDTVRVLGAVSKGELGQKIQNDYKGLFHRLKNNVNDTVDRLTEVSSEMKNGADSVARGASDIFKGNQELAERTTLQQSRLEDTSSTMDQMTAAVKQTASNAKDADQLAADAGNHAENGNNVMRQVESAMGTINDASNKISAITGVIDDIAFQTNLLALNASVEAARAGEQGRGFAVVASEVRNLAGRSATAAREIKDLIDDSVAKIEEGSNLVDKSGKSLQEIVSSIRQVTEIVTNIATASQEQSIGIEQVNQALTEMDVMTKQNSDLVQKVADASKEMGEDASDLKDRVSFFSVGEGQFNLPRAA